MKIFVGLFSLFVAFAVGDPIETKSFTCSDITAGISGIEGEIDFASSKLNLGETGYEILKDFPDIRPYFLIPSQICDGQDIFSSSLQIDTAYQFLDGCKTIQAKITAAASKNDILAVVRYLRIAQLI